MDSRNFIRDAAVLIEQIKTFQASYLAPEVEQQQGNALQKQIDTAFHSLQNPSLPSAYKLRDVATGAGFSVDPRVLSNIARFENIRG